MAPTLVAAFRAWADRALSQPLPAHVAAFSFNLYEAAESFHVELVGCPTYDSNGSEWACTEIFAARDPVFLIPRPTPQHTWQEALATAVQLVRGYLALPSGQAAKLKASRAVAVGFVDGDLEIVWRTAA